MRIGLISDTHGLLRPEALAFLQGSDHIVHAGDIGSPDILDALAELAPLSAIRGNVDTAAWAATIPDTLELELGSIRLLVTHDLNRLERDPGAEGFAVVVSGHSHRPRIEQRGGVLHVNPGSAGRRRFTLPVSAAELVIARGDVAPRIVDLLPDTSA